MFGTQRLGRASSLRPYQQASIILFDRPNVHGRMYVCVCVSINSRPTVDGGPIRTYELATRRGGYGLLLLWLLMILT